MYIDYTYIHTEAITAEPSHARTSQCTRTVADCASGTSVGRIANRTSSARSTSIRPYMKLHTSADVSIRQRLSAVALQPHKLHTSADVSIRQHTSASRGSSANHTSCYTHTSSARSASIRPYHEATRRLYV
jgi:hypothetical protein